MKYVQDKDIYEFYLGHNISFNQAYYSPFREEKRPSMTFLKKDNGAILWRDWGDGMQNKSSSAIDFVMRLYLCTFKEALEHIKEDIGGIRPSFLYTKQESYKRKHKEIHVKTRRFDNNDVAYWNQYGISIDTLISFDVIPIQEWYYNNYKQDIYDGSHPIYAFKFITNGNVYYKIYNPLTLDRSRKWRYNGTEQVLAGFDQLPWINNYIILTKSLKDVMVLYSMGIPAVSLQSEQAFLDTTIYTSLKDRFSSIIVLYDNDTTGIERSNQLVENYGVKQIFIPKRSKCKDISDYVSMYGFEKGKELMIMLLKKHKLEI